MNAVPAEHEAELVAASETYLETITQCVRALDCVFEPDPSAVERVARLESTCDDAGRDLVTRLGSTAPTFRSVYLQAGDLAEFYTRADEVANHAEAVALDCDAMAADVDLVRPHLREMVADAAEASESLESAAASYLDGDSESAVHDAIREIRDRERACDDRRHDAVRVAFDELDAADALIVREIAQGVDSVVDAVEDAADQLHFMVSVTP